MKSNTKPEISSISINLMEVAIDSIFKDGILRDIPFVSTLFSIGKMSKTVTDTLLLNRIICFIEELDFKNIDQIEEFKERYFKNDNYQKIGSRVLLSLEKADDETKIKWIARSFRIFINKEIDKGIFLRLSSIINGAFVSDVEKIVIFNDKESIVSNDQEVESYVLDHLFSIGLLENIGTDGGSSFDRNNGGIIYRLNIFGEVMLNKILTAPETN